MVSIYDAMAEDLNCMGYAPYPAKMSVVRSEYFMDDDTTILVGFGGDHSNVDLNDIADAQEIMNQHLKL